MSKIISLILLIAIPTFALPDTLPFHLGSKDGLAVISGQIDKPNCQLKSYPTVLIVGGTGLFSRSGYFGRSGTPRDFLFEYLSERLTSSCIAVVRFDYRGVSCDIKDKSDVQNCLHQDIRATVTDETKLDDIQTVYDYATSQNAVDSSKFYFIGHSEGSLNVSRLVARHTVFPAGIMFFGGLTESAKSILHWQFVGRPAEWAFEMDINKDGQLTNDEIKSGYETSKFKGVLPEENLLDPNGYTTRTSLTNQLEQAYQTVASSELAHDAKDPYVINGVVFSSYQWWQRWFTDDTSVLDNLKDFTGAIWYHNGDIDSQTPGLRELAFLKAHSSDMNSAPNFALHPGHGHGLGSDMLYGPIDESIANEMVSEIVNWSRSTECRQLSSKTRH